jgi:hypothetical protein
VPEKKVWKNLEVRLLGLVGLKRIKKRLTSYSLKVPILSRFDRANFAHI